MGCSFTFRIFVCLFSGRDLLQKYREERGALPCVRQTVSARRPPLVSHGPIVLGAICPSQLSPSEAQRGGCGRTDDAARCRPTDPRQGIGRVARNGRSDMRECEVRPVPACWRAHAGYLLDQRPREGVIVDCGRYATNFLYNQRRPSCRRQTCPRTSRPVMLRLGMMTRCRCHVVGLAGRFNPNVRMLMVVNLIDAILPHLARSARCRPPPTAGISAPLIGFCDRRPCRDREK